MTKTGFGVIGAGIVGGAWHAHVYHNLSQAELVAVCDLDERRTREFAATADVAMLPPMVIFLLLGPYVVRGLTFGTVKG